MRRSFTRSIVLVALVAACTADNSLGPTERPALFLVDPVLPQVEITEVLPDPTKVLDAQGEWFEIFNAGGTSVDLNGWRIVSGPTGVYLAGGIPLRSTLEVAPRLRPGTFR
jgi:hypothetical protein